jgi:hypothetical protein
MGLSFHIPPFLPAILPFWGIFFSGMLAIACNSLQWLAKRGRVLDSQPSGGEKKKSFFIWLV